MLEHPKTKNNNNNIFIYMGRGRKTWSTSNEPKTIFDASFIHNINDSTMNVWWYPTNNNKKTKSIRYNTIRYDTIRYAAARYDTRQADQELHSSSWSHWQTFKNLLKYFSVLFCWSRRKDAVKANGIKTETAATTTTTTATTITKRRLRCGEKKLLKQIIKHKPRFKILNNFSARTGLQTKKKTPRHG